MTIAHKEAKVQRIAIYFALSMILLTFPIELTPSNDNHATNNDGANNNNNINNDKREKTHTHTHQHFHLTIYIQIH